MALSDAERYVNRLEDREPVDSLKDQRKVQALFQLDHHRAFVLSHSHDIAWPDLAPHRVALGLQEPLDRSVEVDLRHWIPSRRALFWHTSPHGPTRAVDAGVYLAGKGGGQVGQCANRGEQETTWVTPGEGTWVTVGGSEEGELNVLLPGESEAYAAEQRT